MALGNYLTLLIGKTRPVPAPISMIEAFKSIEVTNTDEGRDGFQIIFSVERSRLADILDYTLVNSSLLKPFNRIIVIVTLGAKQHVLIDGIITHQQFSPTDNLGQSTLIITGEDVSVMMDLKEKTVTHPEQSDAAIVYKIIKSYRQYGLDPKVISSPLMDTPLIVDRIPSQQGTDLEYILELAKLYNYVFYIEPTDVPSINTAYWGPANLIGTPQKPPLTFNMGRDTNVTSSINFQYNALSSIMISGSIQDRVTNEPIRVTTSESLRPPLVKQPAWKVNQPNVRNRLFRSKGGLNKIQANTQAQAETDKSTEAVVTASSELDVTHYGDILRARRIVGLRGVGYLHNGLYYVKSVTHKIKRGEYKQSFTLTREGLGSVIPVV